MADRLKAYGLVVIAVMVLLLQPNLGDAATNGNWDGTTDQDLAISFTVSGDQATNIVTRLRVYCSGFSAVVMTNHGSRDIINNSFTINSSTSACTPFPPFTYRPYGFTGTFTDENTCAGTYYYSTTQTGTWGASPACSVPQIDSFSSSTQTIAPGETVTLNWTISNADSAAIDQGIGSVDAASGSIDVTPNQTTTYTLSATNACGTVQATVTVTIEQTNVLTPGVYQLLLSDATVQQLSYPMIYAASDSDSYIDRISIANGAADRFPSAGIANPYGICVDNGNQNIYWTDYGTNTIQRSDFDGSNLEVLVFTGLDVPCGIAVDETNQKMYWTDWGNHTIKRSNMDGSNIEVLFDSSQVDAPVGITLDIANGYFYFADENTGKIQRADLDGGNLTDIATNQSTPHGIVYSATQQKLFWTNFVGDTGSVRCSDPDGSNLAVLVSGIDHPMGITIDTANDQLYYSHSGEIRACNYDGSGDALRFNANHVPFIVFVQQ